jgi:hypothetical protein
VYERIREVKPERLYVAADGAREGRGDELERCKEARAVIEGVDWECEVKTLFRDRNLGCKVAVSEAITWFFEQEEYGIILEDDCLPDPSFFQFCEELLVRYKDDDRIGHISGDCFYPEIFKNGLSYDFCAFAQIWGWASWRRVWKNYDINFKYWEQAQNDKRKINNLFQNLKEKIYFSSFISDAISGRSMNTWDAQYLFMLRTQNQLSVYPSVNLITNIGLNNQYATNTQKSSTKGSIRNGTIKFPLTHPEYIMSNKTINNIISSNFFSIRRTIRYFFNDY